MWQYTHKIALDQGMNAETAATAGALSGAFGGTDDAAAPVR